MEEAIKRAIMGGWEPAGVDFTGMEIDNRGLLFYEDFPEDKRGDIEKGWVYFYDTEYPEEGYYAGMLMEIAVLDPTFWQALGKAEGWKESDAYHMKGYLKQHPDGSVTTHMQQVIDQWQTAMHRFIDHLIDGKDIDSFFLNLLTDKK